MIEHTESQLRAAAGQTTWPVHNRFAPKPAEAPAAGDAAQAHESILRLLSLGKLQPVARAGEF